MQRILDVADAVQCSEVQLVVARNVERLPFEVLGEKRLGCDWCEQAREDVARHTAPRAASGSELADPNIRSPASPNPGTMYP